MAQIDENPGDFEFDPDQLSELGELAEAFIHEEVDAALFENIDEEYLERLVANANSNSPADIDSEVYDAAIEVAELILDRMNADG